MLHRTHPDTHTHTQEDQGVETKIQSVLHRLVAQSMKRALVEKTFLSPSAIVSSQGLSSGPFTGGATQDDLQYDLLCRVEESTHLLLIL